MIETARRRHLLLSIACCCLCTLGFASAYNANPKLVVIVIIDQFRGDYLERYRDQFGPGGFRLFLDRGAVFTNCRYDYANTRTAPGHATLLTGAYTNGHGIAGNEWWDSAANSLVTSVEDRNTKLIGPRGPLGTGVSPRNLLADTLGDELKLATGGKSRVFAIALKDRAAVLPAGYAGDGAYWIEHSNGAFISSSYYLNQLPPWVTIFDTSGRAEKYWDREWKDAAGKILTTTARRKLPDGRPDPKAGFYEVVGSTPFGNDYELEFARELIAQEKLGRGEATDLLSISLSPMDILGHEAGPDDPEMQAMTLALDRQLGEFFRYLNQQLGFENIWLALSADHGVAPRPSDAAKKFRLPAAVLSPAKLREAANKDLAARFPQLRGPAIASLQWPFAFLSQRLFADARVSQAEAERAAGEVLMRVAGWHGFYTRSQLAEGRVPADETGRMYAHSYTTYGGWYVLGIMAPFVVAYAPTDHSSPYTYDRHVPLAFYGAPFVPGVYRRQSAPVDLAMTLASLLGINAPTHAIGRVLTEALADQRQHASASNDSPNHKSQSSR
jgi:hypothetical protein